MPFFIPTEQVIKQIFEMHNADVLNSILIVSNSLIVSWLRRSNANKIELKIHKGV